MQLLECSSIKEKMILRLRKILKLNNISCTLVVIQIGDFKENDIYLNSKKKLALELGIKFIEIKYDDSNSKTEIIDKIKELNEDKDITGIMIQKPILECFDYQELVDYIDPYKDVDGVSSINKERLISGKGIIPCTAKAVLRMCEEYNIQLENRKIAIIGKSDLVGMPLYNLLKNRNEVRLCDSKTENLNDKIDNADIIILAIGKANYFDSSYFRKEQIIIDVGTNYLNGKLVGDVDFEVRDKVSMITPVPGGIGLLTPVCLFDNLIELSLQKREN